MKHWPPHSGFLSTLLAVWVVCCIAPANAAVVTWTNPAGGDWFQPANWDAGVPQAGDDVVIDRPGTYTVELLGGQVILGSLSLTSSGATLLNQGSLTVNGTLELGGGRLDGSGLVRVDGDLQFSSGSLAGSGTLQLNGEATLSSSSTKNIDARLVTSAGSITWIAGDVASSSASLWDQVDGTLTMTSLGGRWTSDGTGTLQMGGAMSLAAAGSLTFFPSLQIEPGGSLSVPSTAELRVGGGGAFGGSLAALGTVMMLHGSYSLPATALVQGGGTISIGSGAEVDLRSDVSMAGGSLLVDGGSISVGPGVQFSPGSSMRVADGTLQFSSGGAGGGVLSRVPTLELSGGDVRVSGDLDVSSSMNQAAGTLLVSLGAEMTASSVTKSGGFTSVDGTVSFPNGLSWTAGSIDLGGWLTLDTANQTGGALFGTGTLTGLGGYDWAGGSWDGPGSSLLLGGGSLSGPGTMSMGSRRVTASSDVTWSDGDIETSSGFLWTQSDGSLTLASAGSRWRGFMGTISIGGSLRSCCTSLGTLAPGISPAVEIDRGGELTVESGGRLDLAGRLGVRGHLDVSGELRLKSAAFDCGGLPGCGASMRVDGGSVSNGLALTHDFDDSRDWAWTPGSRFRAIGGIGSEIDAWTAWTSLEIAGEDLGPGQAGFLNNFELPELRIAPGASFVLEDRVSLFGTPEALYVDHLVFEDTTGRINLNNRVLYYNTIVGNPSQIIDDPYIELSASPEAALAAVSLSWFTLGDAPYRVLRSTSPDSGFTEITQQGGTPGSTFDDGVLLDGQTYYYLVEQLTVP